jgi:hypothetical protein
VLVVIKCIYLPPTCLHFIQDIEDRCLLLTHSTRFVDLPFQEHRITEKHHMDKKSCISSLCPKYGIVTNNMTRGTDVAQSTSSTEPRCGQPATSPSPAGHVLAHLQKNVLSTCPDEAVIKIYNVQRWCKEDTWSPSHVAWSTILTNGLHMPNIWLELRLNAPTDTPCFPWQKV